MDNRELLNDKQKDIADALVEWRDAGGSVELVVLAIQRMIIADMRDVFGDFGKSK